MIKTELKGLANILTQAGVKSDEAESLVKKIHEEAQEKRTSVLRVIIDIARSGADMDSTEFKLHNAIQNVGGIIKFGNQFPNLTSQA
jgi:hypothetical protein